MRRIDANELVSKINKLEIFYFTGETDVAVHDCQMVELGSVLAEIDEAPTVDAVEVVRCKDCKHKTVTSDGMVCECALPTKRMQDYYIYGSTILARVEPDAFCSYGERKDNGT